MVDRAELRPFEVVLAAVPLADVLAFAGPAAEEAPPLPDGASGRHRIEVRAG